MHLYRQTGRNMWRIRWKDRGETRSVGTGTSDRLAAERILATMRQAAAVRDNRRRVQALITAIYPDSHAETCSLEDAAEVYRGQVQATRYSNLVVRHWVAFAKWVRQHRPAMRDIADLDAATCRAYPATLPGAPKTVANTVANCARVYRIVAPLYNLSGDPWRGVKVSKATVTPGRELSKGETDALLAATAGTEYGLAILIALYTGLRYRDVANLRWEDVVGDAIEIMPHKTKSHGIRVHIHLHRAVVASLPKRGTGYILPALAESYGKRSTAGLFASACKAAGIAHEGITFHSLRHTFISRLARAGVPDGIRRRIAGHSVAETHDRYTHDYDSQVEAIDRLT